MYTKYSLGDVVNGYEIIGFYKREGTKPKQYKFRCTKCGFIWDKQAMSHVTRRKNTCCHSYHWHVKRLYTIYTGMKQRCYNTNDTKYSLYGGRGIKVCDEWMNPKNFEQWALDNGYKDGLTIDRIDSNSDYCPENCQWISLSDNSRKTSKAKFITVNGETLTYRQWSNKIGVSHTTINYWRKRYGEDYVRTRILKALGGIIDE